MLEIFNKLLIYLNKNNRKMKSTKYETNDTSRSPSRSPSQSPSQSPSISHPQSKSPSPPQSPSIINSPKYGTLKIHNKQHIKRFETSNNNIFNMTF